MAEWTHRSIELENLSEIEQQARILIKDGNPVVEQIRCVYCLKDEPKIIHMLPLLDYVDNPTTKEDCIGFFFYQMVN